MGWFVVYVNYMYLYGNPCVRYDQGIYLLATPINYMYSQLLYSRSRVNSVSQMYIRKIT